VTDKGDLIESIALRVPGMTCDHCVAAIRGEISKLPRVTNVDIDLGSKDVVVHGSGLDLAAVCAAVEEAGYEPPPEHGLKESL
jgi:copper chaperone